MKKACVLSILGIAASAAHLYGAGHIYFNNYETAPYNQVVYDLLPNAAVRDPSVQIQLWYGEGIITNPNLLTAGGITTIDLSSGSFDPGAGFGTGGYFSTIQQILPTWDPGDTFTFQLRAPAYPGRTILWTEQSAIVSTINPGQFSTVLPRLVLTPEPSALALTGLGIAGFSVFRRRR